MGHLFVLFDNNINKGVSRLYTELFTGGQHKISTLHPHIIRMSSTHHADNIRMSSVCHLHIQNLLELPNFMTWLVFICYIVSAESSSQLVLILSLIFGWTLSVQDDSLVSFGTKFCNLFFGSIWFLRLLLIHILFLTWSACFGSIVFICYVASAGSSSQLVLILTLIFGWTLSVKDVLLISFGRKFCNLFFDQFGFQDCFWYMFCFWLDLV